MNNETGRRFLFPETGGRYFVCNSGGIDDAVDRRKLGF